MSILRVHLAVVSVFLFFSLTGCNEQDQELSDIKEDIKVVKESQAVILKELEEIKTLLKSGRGPSAPSEPMNIVMDVDGAQFKGDKDAKLALIEFSDYQCPFCNRYFTTSLPQIENEYIKTGKVKYVFLNFPLDFHNNAFKAAEAASCAGDQEKFWQMHDRLFENHEALEPADLTKYAEDLNLDMGKFNKCMDEGKYSDKIKNDIAEGQKAGISGTPSFLLGTTNPKDSSVKVVKVIRGAQPYTNFKAAIDGALNTNN